MTSWQRSLFPMPGSISSWSTTCTTLWLVWGRNSLRCLKEPKWPLLPPTARYAHNSLYCRLEFNFSQLRQSIKGSVNKLQRISSFIDQVESRLHKEQQLFCEKIACSMGLSAEVSHEFWVCNTYSYSILGYERLQYQLSTGQGWTTENTEGQVHGMLSVLLWNCVWWHY